VKAVETRGWNAFLVWEQSSENLPSLPGLLLRASRAGRAPFRCHFSCLISVLGFPNAGAALSHPSNKQPNSPKANTGSFGRLRTTKQGSFAKLRMTRVGRVGHPAKHEMEERLRHPARHPPSNIGGWLKEGEPNRE
jgi:hypothetical protein